VRPFVFIRTVWSDDSVTHSEAVEEWFGQWILMTYGDAEIWTGQIRPIRASLVGLHYWVLEELYKQ
jgi:hypothetical protein